MVKQDNGVETQIKNVLLTSLLSCNAAHISAISPRLQASGLPIKSSSMATIAASVSDNIDLVLSRKRVLLALDVAFCLEPDDIDALKASAWLSRFPVKELSATAKCERSDVLTEGISEL